jgi:beta-N-acetylglucosaminidase
MSQNKKARNRFMSVITHSIILTIITVFVMSRFPVAQDIPKQVKMETKVNYITYDTSIESLEIEQRSVPRHIVVSRSIESRIPIINYDDLTIRSNLTVNQAESMLKGGLKGLGKDFVESEHKWNVNALFMISLARQESGNGSYRLMDRNNIFSFGAFDGNVDNATKFDSLEECISLVTHYIAREYLSVDGKHYNGLGLNDVAESYASDSEWNEKIKELIDYELDKMKGE